MTEIRTEPGSVADMLRELEEVMETVRRGGVRSLGVVLVMEHGSFGTTSSYRPADWLAIKGAFVTASEQINADMECSPGLPPRRDPEPEREPATVLTLGGLTLHGSP